jgi:hypothetical protein
MLSRASAQTADLTFRVTGLWPSHKLPPSSVVSTPALPHLSSPSQRYSDFIGSLWHWPAFAPLGLWRLILPKLHPCRSRAVLASPRLRISLSHLARSTRTCCQSRKTPGVLLRRPGEGGVLSLQSSTPFRLKICAHIRGAPLAPRRAVFSPARRPSFFPALPLSQISTTGLARSPLATSGHPFRPPRLAP